jgi:hypothetical protein
VPYRGIAPWFLISLRIKIFSNVQNAVVSRNCVMVRCFLSEFKVVLG